MPERNDDNAQSPTPTPTSTPAPDPAPDTTPDANTPDPLQITRSSLGRRWVLKRFMFILITLGLGVWGVADAFVIYPSRGKRAAEAFEHIYLDQLRQARGGSLDDSTAGVADPKAKFAALKESVSGKAEMSNSDRAIYQWLEQLSYLGRLNAAYTAYPRKADGQPDVASAEEWYAQLHKKWTTAEGQKVNASPLTFYDLPSQYLIMALFIPWGLYLLADYAKSRRNVFAWDPATQRLTVPGGGSVVPTDLAEVDKRKWDKFYVTLKVKDAHPELAGRSLEIDLMRYEPVEAWILAMERAAFPENTAPPAPPPA